MTDTNQKKLGSTLWAIADPLRGAMDADGFRGREPKPRDIEPPIADATPKHNAFLKEPGLPSLP